MADPARSHRIHRPLAREAQPPSSPGIIPRTALESIIGPVALAQDLQPDPSAPECTAPYSHALPVLGHKRKHPNMDRHLSAARAPPSRTGGNVAITRCPNGTRLRRRALRSSPPGRCRKLRLDCVDVPPSSPIGRHPGRLKRAARIPIPNSYATVLQPLFRHWALPHNRCILKG